MLHVLSMKNTSSYSYIFYIVYITILNSLFSNIVSYKYLFKARME